MAWGPSQIVGMSGPIAARRPHPPEEGEERESAPPQRWEIPQAADSRQPPRSPPCLGEHGRRGPGGAPRAQALRTPSPEDQRTGHQKSKSRRALAAGNGRGRGPRRVFKEKGGAPPAARNALATTRGADPERAPSQATTGGEAPGRRQAAGHPAVRRESHASRSEETDAGKEARSTGGRAPLSSKIATPRVPPAPLQYTRRSGTPLPGGGGQRSPPRLGQGGTADPYRRTRRRGPRRRRGEMSYVEQVAPPPQVRQGGAEGRLPRNRCAAGDEPRASQDQVGEAPCHETGPR